MTGDSDAPERLLTTDDVAARLSVARSRVYDLVRRNAIPSVRVGKLLRFRPADVEAYIAQGGDLDD